MSRARSTRNRLYAEQGEVASWLIVMAALAMAAALAAGVLHSTIVELAERVARAEATTGGEPNGGQPAGTGDIPGVFPEAVDPSADDGAPPGSVDSPEGPAPEGPAEADPDGDDPTEAEPEPITPETQAALDRIVEKIDNGDDLGMSEGELDDVRDELKDLSPEEREQVIAALTDEQLERLFHNVHSSGFWSNDWNDKERNEFYTLLKDLSTDQQQRLAEHTDYFDLYDSDLNPLAVPVSEADFVTGYEEITELDLDEFLALRAYMWDNPELIADSPFDWYADGCSIPGGVYPGALNGPCLLHDFAYTNARIATRRFATDYTTLDGNEQAQAWKDHADERLRTDIESLPPSFIHDYEWWAGTVYTGVTIEIPGAPSGRKAFEARYGEPRYGPGFDPNLGQWPDDHYDSYRADELVTLATNGSH